jgi:hypothetical protein
MTEKPTKIVHNFDTGLTEIIELTDEEIAEREAQAIAYAEEQAAREAELAAKETARASAEAKLATLGLTPEEIQALKGN